MRNKQYGLLFLMALAMVFVFCACGKTEKAPAAAPEASTKETAVEAEASTKETSMVPEETTQEGTVEAEVNGAPYGYSGDDPVEAAVYKYMVEEMSKGYGEAQVHIPTVSIVHEDYTPEDEILVYGDFWIENYNIDGETLKCVSGGNHPGVMHLNKDYTVTAFDQAADGEDFEASAKKLFGEHYEDFMKVYGDSDARNELRKITISDYVKMNGLSVTQYQDEGWDPVELYK